MSDLAWLCPKQPVWVLKNSTFIKGIVESVSSDSAICSTEEGTLLHSKKPLIFQRDPAYKEFSKERWDLMDTDILNEPEVLKTLKFRLENKRIYTFIQNSVLSVNPYTSIPLLYSDDLKRFYAFNIIECQENIRDFEPHLYSIVAYMLSELKSRKRNQAVIISGESGAGKTEANKECLRFLQYYFHEEGGSIDKDIDNILTLSTPILEAFGNSKTIRNNNSSRFGKYLNIFLNDALQVKHVKIYNYLLEKSRIISRADNEQNFHIFYELLKGLSRAEKNKYFLEDREGRELRVEDFSYLRNPKAAKYEQHPDVSFEKVKMSLLTLKDKNSYDFVCRVLAAVLLLGNVVAMESEGSSVTDSTCRIHNQETFLHVCHLLGIKKDVLLGALSCYQIKIGSETLTKFFNSREVQELINSFSKLLYERLFQWIINEINSISHYSGEDSLTSLGFLDIYGFEILESNSLEQLFINYTNERLHQIYLSKIFKEEGELFAREGLGEQFKAIPYSDNMPVLELIDYQPLSIFNLLDEWCSVASPDDSSFITKLRHKHKKHTSFPTANFNLPSTLFLIRHSPKDIEYAVAGFREKNKDLVRDQIKTAVRSSALPTVAQLLDDVEETRGVQKEQKQGVMQQRESRGSQGHKLRKFLSSKFRHEMNNLMVDLLGSCDLHFIRCVKSNSFKQALLMEDEVVYNQICYLGVLDTIRLKKTGYCIKLPYELVDKRFRWLVRYYFSQPAFPKEIIKSLRSFLPRFDEELLFGNTMVFFRDFAYTALVKKYQAYVEELGDKCRRVQGALLKWKYMRKVGRKRQAVEVIRGYLRAKLAAQKHQQLMRGVLVLQRAIREKLKLFHMQKKLKNMLIFQAYIKKETARRSRLKYTKSLQIIINAIQRYRSWRLVQKFAIVNQLKEHIVEKSYRRLTIKKKNVIEAYLLGFLTQLGSKALILTANLNTRNKFAHKYTQQIQAYLKSFAGTLQVARYLSQVVHTQSILKTWIYRRNFLKLRAAAVTIQRAYREYYFNKNTAREIFNLNFGEYQQAVQSQNQSIRSFLYQNDIQDSLRILYQGYFKKFKEKCSLVYFLIDFESFINMEHCYPENSWLLNYFQVVKEGFEKDSPIQALEMADTFTVAATTSRLYLWGINQDTSSPSTDTLHKAILIKPNKEGRVEKAAIVDNKLQITYEGAKQPIRSSCTVPKKYSLDNGKVYECAGSAAKLIKVPHLNQRMVEIACGASHVVLRSSSKRVYTFGSGKEGQLGHGNYFAVDSPKLLEFQELKNYYPLQVSASFNSSILLLSNRKIYWFGSNGTISRVRSPVLLDLSKRFEEFSEGEFAVMRVRGRWSRSMSVVGVTLMRLTGKLCNVGLRNRVVEMMVAKWQEQDIDTLSPPFSPAYSDYLEECHVRLPRNKVSVEPESKRILKQLEEKVSKFQTEKYNDISFSDPAFR